jgi:hypothetical protein
MNPWIAKAPVLAGAVVMIAIRAPHGRRSRIVKVATSHKTPLETGLLVLAWVGFFVPLIWVASPAFSFAEYLLGSWYIPLFDAVGVGPEDALIWCGIAPAVCGAYGCSPLIDKARQYT